METSLNPLSVPGVVYRLQKGKELDAMKDASNNGANDIFFRVVGDKNKDLFVFTSDQVDVRQLKEGTLYKDRDPMTGVERAIEIVDTDYESNTASSGAQNALVTGSKGAATIAFGYWASKFAPSFMDAAKGAPIKNLAYLFADESVSAAARTFKGLNPFSAGPKGPVAKALPVLGIAFGGVLAYEMIKSTGNKADFNLLKKYAMP